MRGFRASRAMQNFKASHYGKPSHLRVVDENHGGQDPQSTQVKQPLPAWLRLPEAAKSTVKSPKKARAKTAVKTRKRKAA